MAPLHTLAQDSPQNQRFTIVATDVSGTGHLVATGPISEVGTDTTVGHTANPDGTFTDSDRFDLPGGQVFLSDTYTAQITSDPRSCASTISVAGSYTIIRGTGAYADVRGSGTFTASGLFVAGRDAAGACLGLDTTPLAFAEIVRGVGTTNLL